MTTTVVDAHNLSKCYPTYASNLARFGSWFGLPIAATGEFWALRDFSARLNAGEALAVIGANGAGKSTLLKVITGAVRPTTGHIALNGDVAAILELGLGFNVELTGRQNVYHAAGLRGFSRDRIDAMMPEIEAFAELPGFFDKPLRVYSSGMQARLAFALVTAARPQLLIVDEILSVGDAYFQHKSFERIRRFKEAGTAILFVSHSMGDVRALCDRVILLEKGRVIRDGAADEVIDLYHAKIAQQEAAALTIDQRRAKNGWLVTRSGTFDATVAHVDLLHGETREPIGAAQVGQPLLARFSVVAHRPVANLVLGCMLRDRTGHVVWGSNTWHTRQSLGDLRQGEEVEFFLNFPCNLGPGSYSLTHALTVGHHHAFGNYEWVDNSLVFEVINVDRPFFIGTTHLDAAFEIKRTTAWTPSPASA